MTSRRRALLAIACIACALALPGQATAQEAPPEVGWWTSNQVAGVPIGRALLVPPGGSQVAAGAEGAVSVAAVRFAAGPAGATYRVGIELGSDTDGVSVIACPVVGTWDAAHGAPLAEAPAWDCTLAQAAGTLDAAAGTIAWDLPAAFVRDGTVEAMLLPPDAGGSFTFTMAAPGEGAVTPLAEPSPTTTPTDPAPAPAGPPGADAAGAPPAPPPTGSGPLRPTTGPAPSPTAPAGLPSPLPTTPTAAGGDREVATAPAEDVSSTSGRVLGGAVLAALLAGAAIASRRAPTAAAGDAGGRGVGRFVRVRNAPPLSI